ncbi:UDP-glucose:undecaprenyl-phosphate glucose-1-phosphate transferase, partial [Klebsiella pneumoniae]
MEMCIRDRSRTEEINGVPVVPLFDTPLNGINMVFKRMEDIIVSSIIQMCIRDSYYIMIYLQCFIDNHNTRKFILYTFPPLNTHFNACFRIAKQKGKFISQLFR